MQFGAKQRYEENIVYNRYDSFRSVRPCVFVRNVFVVRFNPRGNDGRGYRRRSSDTACGNRLFRSGGTLRRNGNNLVDKFQKRRRLQNSEYGNRNNLPRADCGKRFVFFLFNDNQQLSDEIYRELCDEIYRELCNEIYREPFGLNSRRAFLLHFFPFQA